MRRAASLAVAGQAVMKGLWRPSGEALGAMRSERWPTSEGLDEEAGERAAEPDEAGEGVQDAELLHVGSEQRQLQRLPELHPARHGRRAQQLPEGHLARPTCSCCRRF
ncbi:hypothetical protein SETIT_9G436600v2 [Setaria italica]|uniref:Uncharacterized protein n=1 Tax=Setaria italica TaxID=4555 RepID=K4AGZ2_SETIT|nr:hypothetical protein SETIT_9G436600v2 [Setaria italica]